MLIRVTLLGFAVALAPVFCDRTAANTDFPGARSPAFAHEASDHVPDPRVRYGVLENGFRYAIMRNATPAGAASMRLAFDVGSLMENDDERGIAHFLEHMAFKGSTNVPEGEIGRILQRHGLSFGAHVNAGTSFGATIYMLELSSTAGETLDAGFMLFSELDRLTLAEEAVEAERGVVLAEMRGSATPDRAIADARLAFLFPDSLLGDRAVIGTAESLAVIDAAMLRDFHGRFYTPGRAFLVVVGDIDLEDVEARIRNGFGGWAAPEAQTSDPDIGEIGTGGLRTAFFQAVNAPSTVGVFSVKPAPERQDGRAARVAEAAVQFANSIVSRRLAAIARSDQAPILAGQGSYSRHENRAEMSAVQIVAPPGQWRDALITVEHELRRALQFGFTQAEIDEIAANLRAQLAARAAQLGTTPNPLMAQQIVTAFMTDNVFTSPEYDLALLDEVADLLTPEAVSAAYRESWANVAPAIFVTDAEPLEDAEAVILAAYEAAAAKPLEGQAETESVAFAYTDFGPAGTVASRDVISDLDIVRIRFANNVMLNFKQTTLSADSVAAMLVFGGGALEFSDEQPELRHVISILAGGGTEAHSMDELQRLMAGRRVAPNFLLTADAFATAPSSVPGADLTTQLQLWAAYLTAPAFRPEAFTQFRRNYETRMTAMDATAAGVLQRNMAVILQDGKNIPFPPAEVFDRLDADAARAAMSDAFEREAIEIAIVGDITEEDVIDAVARTFGALPRREAAPRPFTEARKLNFPAPGSVTLTHPGPKDTAAVLIAWPTEDATDHARARRLEVLTQVLQLRVTQRVREEAGASYAPFALASMAQEFPGYGYISVRADVKPEDIEPILETIEAEAADLAAGGATQDELDRALQPLIAAQAQQRQQNIYWVQTILRAQSYPERIDRVRTDQSDFAAITLADIASTAAEYLNPAHVMRIEVLPEPVE